MNDPVLEPVSEPADHPGDGLPGSADRFDLPRLDRVLLPPQGMLRRLRPWAERYLRRRYRITVSGTEHLPASGPVIVAANHSGWLDGPLLVIMTPRPLHALTKREMFGPATPGAPVSKPGLVLLRAGQIPVLRQGPDPYAVKTALRVLAAGEAVGLFPEGTRGDGEMRHAHGGAAYLALASGAPIVPVAILGTRAPGAPGESRPAPGARLHLAYGPPLRFPHTPWPRRRETVAAATEELRATMAALVQDTADTSGLPLPGPLTQGDDR